MSGDAARGIQYVAKLTGGRFASQLILVVTAVVLPRFLGAEDYGTYAAWMAIIAIMGGLATLGLPMVETRYLAPLWGLGRRDEALQMGSTIWLLKLAVAAVAALGVVLWLGLSPGLNRGLLALSLLGVLALGMYAHEAATSLLLPFARVGSLSAFLMARAILSLPAVLLGYWYGGVIGVAAGLAALFVALWLASWWFLLRVSPVGPSSFQLASLLPFVAFAASAFAANLAWRVQGQFSIYALANWVAAEQAAYLALALQLYNFLQLLVLSARRALTPLLGEMAEKSESARMVQWAETFMSWTAAAITACALGWALIGREIVHFIFTDTYAAVHPVATWILLCALWYGCAESCNMLLYVEGRAGNAALTMAVYTVGTILGLVIAVRGPTEGTAERVALAYLAAGVMYFAISYVRLAQVTGLRIPLARAALLALPAASTPWLMRWEAGATYRVAILVACLAALVSLGLALDLRLPGRAPKSSRPSMDSYH